VLPTIHHLANSPLFDLERIRGFRPDRHGDHVMHGGNVGPGRLLSAQGDGRGGRRPGRRPWRTVARLAVVACVLAVTVIDFKYFLYGDPRVLKVGVSPTAVVVSPDGRTIYLANSDDSISQVSAVTGKAGRPIAISGGSPGLDAGPGSMAITPDGRTLFTTVTDPATEASLALARVDLRTGREVGRVQVPGGVDQFVMTKDGSTLYVITGDGLLYAVDAATGLAVRLIPAPDVVLENAETMVLSPDGITLWIATNEDGPDASAALVGAVTPVNVLTGVAGSTIGLGWLPVSLAITPDGRSLYVAIDGRSGMGQLAPNSVTVIDTATGRVRASLPWTAGPLYLQMAPDGATVWVLSIGTRTSTADNTVTPVNVASDRPASPFRTSGWLNSDQYDPSGAAMSPDGRTLYVTVPSGLESFRVSWASAAAASAMAG
jgi:DNA-binding beta-propeller fold protein YncE